MRIWTIKRWLSVLVAAGYVLAVTTASLFHNHTPNDDGCGHSRLTAQAKSSAGHHGESNEHLPRPTAPSQHPTDDNQCPVCQFLAQKPAPAAEVASVNSGILAQEAFLSSPARVVFGVFSAWRSRAPPAVA